MDGVIIYIVAYVDIQVTRFETEWDGEHRLHPPSPVFKPEGGREELSYATAAFLSIFTNSCIGANTQFF